ncbi:DUF2194 domain-containing protein [Paenibacillus turpanensis]|uniref:DUF2194 domain-containing protein n=1 Tax=Paenibacillus turpanensis TaxID=2689078 RepID=UPI00140BBB37|nr:DUF2194 domain-containing protein [Paenibacillus turpanensis]
MRSKIKLKRSVYFILLGILLLAAADQITHSKFILQFIRNGSVSDQLEELTARRAVQSAASDGLSYCLVYDSEDEKSIKIQKNAEKVLHYMKKPAASTDVRQSSFSPDSCKAVIVSIEELNQLNDLDRLSTYVENGGSVFLATAPNLNDAFYRIYRKLGVVSASEMVLTKGIELTSNVLIGSKGLRIEEGFLENDSMPVELDKESTILAKTSEGVPLLWSTPYGSGKFFVFNGRMLEEKINRGLLAGTISMMEPDFIYPIFNVKVMYIDDFPAPIAKGVRRDIFRQFNRDTPAFFKDVWWPDMLKAAKKHNLKFTAVLIQTYNNKVEPPFTSPVDEDTKGLISYGREVIKSGGEIGLHGYNHQSLQLSQEVADEFGYNAWPSIEAMAESVKESLRFADRSFPSYKLYSYVPPSNVLSPEGREALKLAWPSLKIISSLYEEDASGLSYSQEFEIAPDNILEMPRFTDGYTKSAFTNWEVTNAITSLGAFSHFIHPDDMLDPVRSKGLPWEKLYKEYDEMMAELNQTYPWLRARTSVEAGIDVMQTLTSEVRLEKQNKTIRGTISPFEGKPQFIMRTNRTITHLTGCQVQKIDDGVLLVEALEPNFLIELSE